MTSMFWSYEFVIRLPRPMSVTVEHSNYKCMYAWEHAIIADCRDRTQSYRTNVDIKKNYMTSMFCQCWIGIGCLKTDEILRWAFRKEIHAHIKDKRLCIPIYFALHFAFIYSPKHPASVRAPVGPLVTLPEGQSLQVVAFIQ